MTFTFLFYLDTLPPPASQAPTAGLCSAWPAKLLNADLTGDGPSGRKEMKYDLRPGLEQLHMHTDDTLPSRTNED